MKYTELDALLLRARKSGLGSLLHPLLLLYREDRCAAEIARGTGVSSAASTGIIDRLEKLGFAGRVPVVDDRRKRIVRLTEKGREAAAKVFGELEIES